MDEQSRSAGLAAPALREAGLRYVSDDMPGIRRRRAGKGFAYRGLDGAVLREPEILAWIRSLGIPPAWTKVWISPHRDGHLLAVGRDAKGRKQYRYHPAWRALRDEAKFERVLAFGRALPRIRATVAADLRAQGLGRRKVLAIVVRLLETTLIRVGNEEYARANRSFGLTTMRGRHVKAAGAELRFCFRGKSGKQHVVTLRSRRLAQLVRRLQERAARSCSSSWARTAGRSRSIPGRSTITCARSPAASSRPRTSAPGRPRCSPPGP